MIAGIATLVLMILFLAGVAWAFSRKRKPEFDAAARLPLEDQSENTP
ncbi:MAG: cbb3-type cytochrome c oxidase subunit 3 [Caulobacteraceae bacterium]|nr:cbb3-type cytochrome c oxidase subunit 3 [Caulobacteraceae bacterium]